MAKTLINENSPTLVSTIAGILAAKGELQYASFFEEKMRTMSAYNVYSVMTAYGNFLARMEDATVIRQGVETITEAGLDDTNWWMSYGAIAAIQNVQLAQTNKHYELTYELESLDESEMVRRSQLERSINEVNDLLDFINAHLDELGASDDDTW
jgi:hypothetical protein